MSRHLRNFTAFQRQFSRNYFPSPQNGSVRVQRVRILRPLLRNRFLPKAIFWSIAINLVWLSMDRRQKEKAEEKDSSVSMKEAVDQVRAVRQTGQVGPGGEASAGTEQGIEAVPEGEDEDEWEDEDLVPEKQPDGAWFIPLWLAQQLPTVNYTAEDEEFQAYLKFHDNGELVQRTRMRLIGAVHHGVANTREFQRMIGAPIWVGKTWIEVFYPPGPPPEYERLGIEVTDDYVALLYRPVEQRNYSRLQNALFPKAAAESFYWSTLALFRMQHGRIQKLFGDSKDVNDEDQPHAHSGAGETNSSTAEAEKQGPARSKDPNQSRKVTGLPLPGLPDPHEDLKKFVLVLRRNLFLRSRVRISPPRGTIMFRGSVEMVGKHGLCVCRVVAIYDPNENKFKNIYVTPRRPTRRKLTPKQ